MEHFIRLFKEIINIVIWKFKHLKMQLTKIKMKNNSRILKKKKELNHTPTKVYK